MHDLTAKNAASSQDAMEGICIQLTTPTQAGENKREELEGGKKKETQLNIYRGLLHFNRKQFFRSAEIFQLC